MIGEGAVYRAPPGDCDEGSSYRLAFAAFPEGLLILDEDLRILEVNAALAGMLGLPAGAIAGMSALDPRWDFLREDGSPMRRSEVPSLIAPKGAEARRAVVGIARRGSKEPVWAEISAVPGPATPSGARGTLVCFKDITDRKNFETRLARKVGALNAISAYAMRLEEASLEGVYSLVAATGLQVFGAAASAIASYDAGRKELVLREMAWAEEPDRTALRFVKDKIVKGLSVGLSDGDYGRMLGMKVGLADSLHGISFGRVPLSISNAIQRRLGIGWFRGIAFVSRGELFGGQILAGKDPREAPDAEELRVFAEVTASAIKRKQAEEKVGKLLAEKETLLQEVHHRVKNNMSTMISLLSLQSRAAEDAGAKAALTGAMGRLQSMNTLYEKLFRAESLREMSLRDYLPALAREIVGMFPDGGRIIVEEDVDDIRLDVKRLSAIGILADEIIVNSMKYAFADRDGGSISLSAKSRGRRVFLEIGDDGAGMPASVDLEDSPGFGLGLIRILARQLDAALSVERSPGTRFKLEFDL